MTTEFKLPELGENIDSGDLVRLLVKPGASIAEGEPVMELETDKAVVEVPSSVTGTVGEVRVKEGDKLRVGQVIFTVENGAGSAKATAEPRSTRRSTEEGRATGAEASDGETAGGGTAGGETAAGGAAAGGAAARSDAGLARADEAEARQGRAGTDGGPAGGGRAGTPVAPASGDALGAASKPGNLSGTGGDARRSTSSSSSSSVSSSSVSSSSVSSSSASSLAASGGEFRLPELGENIDSGDLVRLMIAPGGRVSEGQPVMELETEKAVVEVPASVSGVVLEVKVKEGQRIKVGQVIFTLEGGGAAPAEAPRRHEPVEHISGQQAARLAFQHAMRAEGKTEEQALPPDRPVDAPSGFSMPVQLEKVAGSEHRDPVPAAPHVRRLAREIGIDIHSVRGSGPGGRISEDDVKVFAKNALATATAAAQAPAPAFVEPELPDFAKWGKTERVSMRGVRRKTAEHLRQAWNTIPHVTQQDRADITELEQLRAKFAPRAEEAGGKMTVTAIALKVCASALKVFPQFNASIDMAKEEIVYKQYINIGVAVDTDRGLLVPVIREVDKKNIVELAAQLTQMSKKAKDRKLTPDEMEGGTFTITNLGGIGGTGFSPIVNHPEVAILGLSRSRMEPEWVGTESKFEPRLILPLSLSYDHRLIDGADAARFLRWIAEAFEQPFLLSVQG